jgi:hypothetical protein
MDCPKCGVRLAAGEIGGTGRLSWVPAGTPTRRTLFKNTIRPATHVGRMRWPFWTARAARCQGCGIAVVSTGRGREDPAPPQ